MYDTGYAMQPTWHYINRKKPLTQRYQRIGFCSAVCYMPTLRPLDSVTTWPEVKPFTRRIGHLYDTMDTRDGDQHELPPVLT